jgi:DNA-binding MarR family transcriptional regulator
MNKVALNRDDNHAIYKYSHKMSLFFQRRIAKFFKELSAEMGLKGTVKFSHYYLLCSLYYEGPMSLVKLSGTVGTSPPNITNGINELIGSSG